MDYDYNDLQSSNLHLAGEGNNKFLPVLCPYALPRFDFDDNLHGHLRFDSLAETDVFLGIESSEDNQWIEDFSQGSTGIAFSSSAAEPCSISRCNNVWSEAASSESVEMLLKSVRQDESILGQTISKDSDACDELGGGAIKLMEPSLKPGESDLTEVGDALQPASQADEIPGKFYGLKGDVSGDQLVDSVSQTQESKASNTSNTDLSVRDESKDGEQIVVSESQVEASFDQCMDNREQVDNFSSGTQIDILVPSVQNTCESSKDSDACDELGDIIKQMEPNLKHGDSGPSEVGDRLQPSLWTDEFPGKFYVLKGVSSPHEFDSSVDGTLKVPNTRSIDLPERDNKDENKVETSVDQFVDNREQLNKFALGSQVDTLISSVQNTCASSVFLESQDTTHLKNDTVDENVNSLAGENVDLSQEIHFDGENLIENAVASVTSDVQKHSVSNMQSTEDGRVAGNITPTVGEPSKRTLKENSDLHTVEECSEGLAVESPLPTGISNANVLSVGKLHDISPMPFFGDTIIKEQESEISNIDTQISVIGEPKLDNMDSMVQITCDATEKKDLSESDCHYDMKILSSKSEKHLLSVEDGKGSKGERDCAQNTLGAEPMRVDEDFIVTEHTDDSKFEQSGSVAEKQSTKLPSHSIKTDRGEYGSLVVIKRVDSSSFGTSDTANELASNLLSDAAISGKSGDNAKTHDSSFPSAPSSEPQTKTHMKECGRSADLENRSCGSPILIRTFELSESNTGMNTVKGSKDPSASVSGVISEEANKEHSISQDTKGNDAFSGDRNFTFEILPMANLSEKEAGKNWQPFSSVQHDKISLVGERIPSTSASTKVGPETAEEVSRSNLQTSKRDNVSGGSKGTPASRRRRVGSKSTGKEAAKKGIVAKDKTPARQSKRSGKTSKASLSTAENGQLVKSNEMQHFGHMEVFHQPFTDSQQVQLRAQIFVYGALIQGTAPDEAYMISAFGGHDGRTIWEKAWGACMDRVCSQKSHPFIPETLLQAHIGAKTPDQSIKQTALQTKITSSPASQSNSRGTTSSGKPMIPLSSPLWVIPTPSGDALQPASIPRGAVVDYQHGLSPLHSSVSTVPMVRSGGPANVFAGIPLLDNKKETSRSSQSSADPKPRKRKKSVSEDPGQIIPHSQAESVFATVVNSHASSPAAITTPDNFITFVSADHIKKDDRNSDQKATLSEETLGKLKEAQKQAEDAGVLASTVVCRTREIWNQLEKQKNSVLTPDVETKLTSAAVTIAAAAAVAKAAAAAASVASNAALQAKLMADEAWVSSGYRNPTPTTTISFDSVNLGKATPASILRGEDVATSSNSVIAAAKEASRRRVEAASAASKQAENIDAIVKAAELAAEAVSQAGKIVMGGPFRLTELVEAGPEAYWKVPHASSEPNGAVREHADKGGNVEAPGSVSEHPQEVPTDKSNHEVSPILRDTDWWSIQDDSRLKDGILGAAAISGNDKKGRKVSDIAKSKGVSTKTEHGKEEETLKDSNMREGSHVEVLRDGGGSKLAWFPADILDLKDGKAYVCYNELRSEDGDRLKEWVELEGERDKEPRIRSSRPITVMPFERTRKRRRATMGDYNWSIGDRVDAWMQDSWWEGVISERSKNDETSYTVRFRIAQGETSIVKTWLLRPSLVWKNGNWVEWSISGDSNGSSLEGDTPLQKRPRINSPVVGTEEGTKGFGHEESKKPDDTRLLDLPVGEKLFSIGKYTGDESKPGSQRMKCSGLKKEDSRVIFGVPKPGKKRKFMEVSKHYVTDWSSRTHETSDSTKFAKSLIPRGSEPKEKRMAVSKPKVLKSGKPPSVSSRTIPQKDSLSINVGSEPDDDEIISGEHNTEFRSVSSSDGAAEGPVLFSSVAASSDAPREKAFMSNAKSERISKGKLAPASGKLAKVEEETKTISDAVERRRSNRMIQPTSRLLEGLQSSLLISKVPVPHDQGHKGQSRSARGNN